VTCDLDMDTADFAAGRKITVPLLVIWGGRSHTQGVHGDVLSVWQKNYAENAWGGPLPCGHYVAEEAPDETYAHFVKHFKD
jgi:haloacetate dehalogenase